MLGQAPLRRAGFRLLARYLRRRQGHEPRRVQFPVPSGFRPFRTRARPRGEGLDRRLSALQHRADRSRPPAHHAGGGGVRLDDQDRIYLHRGIAGRQFQKSFVLADGILVEAASLDNGLLHIDLRRPSIEPKVRKVEIRTPANGKAKGRIEVG